MKKIIQTNEAPAAIGTYSQAVKAGNQVYISGQIPLDPKTMLLVSEEFRDQVRQVFKNLKAVAEAAGGDLKNIVKLNIFVCDLSYFPIVNEVMAEFFVAPYPARAVVGVSALPKNAMIEADAIMSL
jgi:reactive intermediate/imine deaminase